MNKLEQALIADLTKWYPCRSCGANHYPVAWKVKTREKMVREGKLEQVVCGFVLPHNMALRVKASA
jgi:hypothetical protein